MAPHTARGLGRFPGKAGVHPIIRILCFLVFAGWLAAAGPERLMAALSLLFIAAFAAPAGTLNSAWTMLRRLRWFFLSLLIVYGWFASMPADGASRLLPSMAGLFLGAERMLALACIVYGVCLLLRTSTREDLLRGIYGLARSFAVLGLRPERLALRLLLVLDSLDTRRASLRAELPSYSRRVSVSEIGAYAAHVLEDTIDRAERRESEEIVFDPGGLPPLWQWLLPPALFGLLALLGVMMQAALAA
jgi:hypothetical protein